MTDSKGWSGFRSVLCPVDFSEFSRHALRSAVVVALRGKAALRIMYVNDPLLVAAASAALHDRHLVERSARELKTFIDATVPAKTRARLRITSCASTGVPADRILTEANDRAADLIVLGTHGLTGVDRLLIGSTTLNVLQRTKVPVLAVPDGHERRGGLHPSRRIVAALDLDGAAAGEVDVAARVAQWLGSSLLLLHVISDIAAPAWLTGDLSAHERIRVAQAQQRLERLAVRAQRRVSTEACVTCGRVADEIAALAAAEDTGLVIAALRDRRGWFGARRGSIAYHVLSHAVTPVLAYPSQWRPR
jgi:nucleotide-binding universal stress UspA family protein